MSYASRVKAGAEFLDSMEPRWYQCIDVDSFSILSTEDCILAQVFNGFRNAEYEIATYGEGVELADSLNGIPSRKWLDDHAFDLTTDEYFGDTDTHVKWIELRWVQEINKRKS